MLQFYDDENTAFDFCRNDKKIENKYIKFVLRYKYVRKRRVTKRLGLENVFARLAEEGQGGEVNLTNVPARKLQTAYEERGLEVDTTESEPGKRTATVNKVVVKGNG